MHSRHALWVIMFVGCTSREEVLPAVDSGDGVDSQIAIVDTSAFDTELPDTRVVDSGAGDTLDAHVEDTAETSIDAVADVVDLGDGAPPWSPVCLPGTPDAETDAESGTCDAVRVRVVAANLTSGNFQRYEAPGIRILQGLRPDIVLVQEMNYAGLLRDFVNTTFGPTFHYYVETGTGIPNGIVSRYPIIASGEWDDPDLSDRDFAWARIDIPGPIDLWAVSVHLRTASATARDTGAKKLVDYIRANVPTTDYLVIGGDLNTDNELEPALTTFATMAVTTAPYAVDQAGLNKTNSSRSKPYDWLLPSPSLHAHMIPVRVGSAEFPSGLVFDTRVFTPLADVAPALATDSAATSMQHMAVVRDYAFAGP